MTEGDAKGTLVEEIEPDAGRDSPGNEGVGPEDAEQEPDEGENEESQESTQTTATTSQPGKGSMSLKQQMKTPPASPPPKRRWTTTSTHLGTLAEAVGTLVTELISPKATPSKGKKRRKEAWRTVKAEDGLSPLSLSKARKVFQQLENVEEYLSFDITDPTDREAHSYWLASEMENLSK
ncbi:hypothetical protein K443DRAFT_4802 [Laccaria amethystina LaAM-08-1]|uniref:Uncharacterized protein n=1 Tax=Laccaria amethystina LaAM-08-1 TaxID=1095629 RepID=A0A0C9XGS2_9AGAR|nr:hypothetical protein K443DRAFT_4802 [Laccaria amethystina LaAM-08-1]